MLEICATDLDAWITAKVEFTAPPMEACCITAQRLRLILETITTEQTEITYAAGKLTIKGGTTVTLNAQPDGEFPEEPVATKGVGVSPCDLADAVEATAWSAGNDPSRNTIDCIEIVMAPKQLEAFGFMGVYGAWFSRALICGKDRLCIPAKQALLMVPALRGQEVVIKRNDNVISVQSKELAVTVKLSASKYAFPMMQIFDQMPKEMSDVSAEFLTRACAQATAVSSDLKRPLLRVERTGSELRVECTEEHGRFNESIEHKSPESLTGIDGGYLAECVSKFGSKSIKLGIINEETKHFLRHGDLAVCLMGRVVK
jgi:hypothetical protein